MRFQGGQTASGSALWRWAQWVEDQFSSLTALLTVPASRSDWYIDAVNGSDSNPGDELARPLRTHRELERRWGSKYLVDRVTTVHVLTDLPEVLAPDVSITGTGALLYDAALQETLYSGTITASSGAPGVDELSLSGVADWATGGPGGSSLVGYLIRDGSNDNIAWASAKLVDASKCRTSTGLIYEKLHGTTASGAFGVGHAVTVERRAAVRGLNASRITADDTRDSAAYGTGAFRMYGFKVSSGDPHNISFGGIAFPYFVACHFPDFVRWHRGHVWLEACRFSPTTGTASVTVGGGSYVKFNRACCNANVRVEEGGIGQFSNACLVQGGVIDIGAGGVVWSNSVSVYDNPGSYAVRVRPGAKFFSNSGFDLIAGATNGVTLWVEAGGLYSYLDGGPPSVPGSVAGEDFRLGLVGTAARPWADLGAVGVFDIASGAAVVPHSSG